jgi:TolB-like protein/Flp pilus assembly protein TadD
MWQDSMARAYFAAEDYDKAVEWGRKAAEFGTLDIELGAAYTSLAASYALMGRGDEARKALAEAVRSRPDTNLRYHEIRYSIANAEHRDRYLRGLRLAGLGPDGLDASALDKQSLVVLPFENLGNEASASFAGGMTIEITSQLATLEGVRMISRTSAVQYAESGKTIAQMAADGIGYVVSGTVRKAGDRLRIDPELIRTADDTRVWGESYDRTIDAVENLIDIQAEIAQEVARHLDLRLLQRPPDRGGTADMDAYTAYLSGLEAEGRGNFRQEDLLEAVSWFAEAVDTDAGYALAWAKLSETHSRIFERGYDRTSDRATNARQAIERAANLEPNLPETHRAAGRLHYAVEHDGERALPELEAAAAGLPNDPTIPMTIAWIGAREEGRFRELVGAAERAALADPLTSARFFDLGNAYRYVREFEKAEEAYQRAIALDPDSPAKGIRGWNARLWKGWLGVEELGGGDSFWIHVRDAHWAAAQANVDSMPAVYQDQSKYEPRELFQGWLDRARGQTELATASFEAASLHLEGQLEERPDDYRVHYNLALAYAALGRREEAIHHGELNVELLRVSEDHVEGPARLWGLAQVYAQVGEAEASATTLEKLFSLRSLFSVALIESDLLLDPIREHPSYRRVIEKYR